MKNFFSALFFCVLFFTATFAQKAEKIDEFPTLACDDYLSRMDGVLFQAQRNPSATIYVFIYEGKENTYDPYRKTTKFILPTRGSAKARIASIKVYAKYRKVSVENFKFIEAGFREESSAEFRLVPKDAEPPKPSPILEKMKYRKGKAKGYRTDCCRI